MSNYEKPAWQGECTLKENIHIDKNMYKIFTIYMSLSLFWDHMYLWTMYKCCTVFSFYYKQYMIDTFNINYFQFECILVGFFFFRLKKLETFFFFGFDNTLEKNIDIILYLFTFYFFLRVLICRYFSIFSSNIHVISSLLLFKY